jgi:hypothetical protein
MLIDNSAAVNLMSYSNFKKLGRDDDELMKTNLMLNGVGGNPMEARGVISIEFTIGASRSLPHSSSLSVGGHKMHILTTNIPTFHAIYKR